MSVSPGQIKEGSSATYTITADQPVSQDTIVAYAMSGRAQLGTDYTLSTSPGQITIAAGQTTAAITLNAITDGVKEKAETAIMTLQPGSGYSFGGGGGKKTKKAKNPSATLTISD